MPLLFPPKLARILWEFYSFLQNRDNCTGGGWLDFPPFFPMHVVPIRCGILCIYIARCNSKAVRNVTIESFEPTAIGLVTPLLSSFLWNFDEVMIAHYTHIPVRFLLPSKNDEAWHAPKKGTQRVHRVYIPYYAVIMRGNRWVTQIFIHPLKIAGRSKAVRCIPFVPLHIWED